MENNTILNARELSIFGCCCVLSKIKQSIESKALSVVHLSPLGSQTSFGTFNQTRIENVADWEAISKKYRALVGLDGEESGSMKDGSDDGKSNNTEMPTSLAAGGNNGNNGNTGNSGAANLV